MIVDVRERLETHPFVPFTIHTADGREYRVPTPDHAHVYPNRSRVSIYGEDGREFIVPSLLISGVAVDSEQSTNQ
ncbi:MAG: hypothetical protein H0W20_11115 [Chthoniobacterales bacterium]|jgi:hypothetical protein|nr:hypothetical protein [Chthoniobacterales bacterium]